MMNRDHVHETKNALLRRETSDSSPSPAPLPAVSKPPRDEAEAVASAASSLNLSEPRPVLPRKPPLDLGPPTFLERHPGVTWTITIVSGLALLLLFLADPFKCEASPPLPAERRAP